MAPRQTSPKVEAVDLDLDEVEVGGDPSGSFRLGGRVWHIRNRDDVSIQFLDDIVTQLRDKGEFRGEIEGFWRQVLVPSELEVFITEVVRAKDSPLTITRHKRAMTGVMELIFRRPTQRSRTSQPGTKRTRATSGAALRSQGTARRASGL